MRSLVATVSKVISEGWGFTDDVKDETKVKFHSDKLKELHKWTHGVTDPTDPDISTQYGIVINNIKSHMDELAKLAKSRKK